MNKTATNYGFTIMDTNESSNSVWHTWYSSDAPSPNKPELRITYSGAVNTPKVDVPSTGVQISPKTPTPTVGINAQTTLTATVSPSNATNKALTWNSSNEKVATVSNGVVRGVSAGRVTITARTSNGRYNTCTVEVKASNVPVTGVFMHPTEVTVGIGKNITLKACRLRTQTKWRQSTAEVLLLERLLASRPL